MGRIWGREEGENEKGSLVFKVGVCLILIKKIWGAKVEKYKIIMANFINFQKKTKNSPFAHGSM